MNPILEQSVRCPGSYLISGPNDGRIMREADAFLLPAFCEKGTGCGVCPGCVQYKEHTHADCLVVDGAKVADAALVPPFLAKKPFEGGLKAVLIPRIDLMNETAQNALLKSVEEPPDGTLVVLGTANLKAVLATIQSRCIRVEALPDTEDALGRLRRSDKVPQPEAEILLQLADGDYSGALRLHEKHYFQIRTQVSDAISKLLFIRSKATSRVENLLAANEDLAFVIEVALLYLADVMNEKYLGPGAVLKNSDIADRIAADARISARRLTRVTDELHRLAEHLSLCKGLNKRLALTAALLNIVEDIT